MTEEKIFHNFELSRVFLLIALLKLWELVYPGALSIKFEPQERKFFSLVTIRVEIVNLLKFFSRG